MAVRSLDIADVKLITPRRFHDERGWFSEVWTREGLAAGGLTSDFRQENQSLSEQTGTIRGLHFQNPPRAQDKLVRVARGRIWDVAVDIRRASSTFGKWVSAEISAEEGNQIWVPKGFAHGFCTLEPNTLVEYLVSDVYSSEDEAAIRWDDPTLGIEWPIPALHISSKDRSASTIEGARILF